MGNIETFYSEQFNTNLNLVAQQKESKFSPYVSVQSGIVGKGAVAAEFIGKTEALESNKRYADTPLIELDHLRRWFSPRTFNWGTAFDDQDHLKMLQDPRSGYYDSAVAAFNRRKDEVIIDGIFNTNHTGEDHEIAEELPTDIIITDTGKTGISSDILKGTTTSFLEKDVDPQEEALCAFISPAQAEKLMKDAEYISDTFGMTVLDKGVLKPFAGIKNFVITNMLPLVNDSGTNYRMCPVFTKDAVGLGVWRDFNSFFFQDATKMNLWRMGASFTIGATRLNNDKIRVLKLAEGN